MPSIASVNGVPPPRARRSSRPTPFTASQPPALQTAFAPTTPTQPHHVRGGSSSGAGYFFPPPGAAAGGGSFGGGSGSLDRGTRWQYETAIELHAAMYGGDCTGSGRNNLRELIEDVYGAEAGQCCLLLALECLGFGPAADFVVRGLGAVFENPMVTARGRDRIADLFCLTGILGGIYSELGDIAECKTYGTHDEPQPLRTPAHKADTRRRSQTVKCCSCSLTLCISRSSRDGWAGASPLPCSLTRSRGRPRFIAVILPTRSRHPKQPTCTLPRPRLPTSRTFLPGRTRPRNRARGGSPTCSRLCRTCCRA